MGSWGYFPKDNDFTLDLKNELGKSVNQWLKMLIKDESDTPKGQWSIIGLIMIVLQAGFFIKRDFIKQIIMWLSQIQRNEKFINTWKNPEVFLKSITVLTNAFEVLYRSTIPKNWSRLSSKDRRKWSRKNNTVVAPRLWLMRDHELKPGNWSGLFSIPEKYLNTDKAIKVKYPELLKENCMSRAKIKKVNS